MPRQITQAELDQERLLAAKERLRRLLVKQVQNRGNR
jgi:hypothetical protein